MCNSSIDLQNFFPINKLKITIILEDTKVIKINLKSQSKNCICPKCNTISNKYHGTYIRKVQDLPILGKQVLLEINSYDIKIQKLLEEIPYTEDMLAIKGIGTMTVAGILTETGDLRNYSHPKQIIKLAGLNLKENSSGTHKGKTTISKRGRAKLRSVLFKCIMPMVCRNEEFKLLHNNFVHRSKNPLKKMQSLIALCGKLIKILFAMAIKGVAYDPTQVICHLTNLQTEQNAV